MTQVTDRDVEAIKEWLAKEPHLPKTFNDMMLRKFLFSCNNSLESTKKCIDEFCTRRANMPEILTKRDLLANNLQKMLSITTVATYTDGIAEILVYYLTEMPDDFDFYTCLKVFSTYTDTWIKIERDILLENQIIIFDVKNYSIKGITKINVFYFKMFVIFLLESMPMRLKHVHIINCPSFFDYIFTLLKPAFPDYLIKMMHFHPDCTGLYKFVNKESLPKEYGGDNQSLEEQHTYWYNDVLEHRKFFIDDNLWKADLSKKVKSSNSDNSMNGSFKTLEID